MQHHTLEKFSLIVAHQLRSYRRRLFCRYVALRQPPLRGDGNFRVVYLTAAHLCLQATRDSVQVRKEYPYDAAVARRRAVKHLTDLCKPLELNFDLSLEAGQTLLLQLCR
jgi:hypothetical protein